MKQLAKSKFAIRPAARRKLCFRIMNESPAAAEELLSIETDVILGQDRRAAPRIDCRTVVTAIPAQSNSGDGELQVIKARSEDISVGGAKIISKDQLLSKRVFLRFLLPTFGDRYVEAEVVNEECHESRSMKGQVTSHYTYGVKFTGLMTDEQLRSELGKSPTDPLP